jgi:Ca-activated chloride channel family protein
MVFLAAGLSGLLLLSWGSRIPAAEAAAVRFRTPVHRQPVFGKIPIEVIVETPEDVRPLKVEIFVDGRLRATLFEPPFKTLWDTGEGADPHLLRAKAYTSDGVVSTAEIRTTPRLGIVRARVLLVEVYVTVKDEGRRFVTDLQEEDFSILEDGVEQDLSLFTTERKPVKVVLLLDVSASMKREERLSTAIKAAQVFVEALEPDDKVSVVTFSDEVQELVAFTSERMEVLEAIASVRPQRGTALYDAIFQAARLLGLEEGRRALVLLSDGQDLAFDGLGAGSLRTFEEAVSETLRQQVTAYTIGLGEKLSTDYDFHRTHSADKVLRRLGVDTGGRFFPVKRPRRLRSAFEKVLQELRFQYTLGYNPSNERRDGTWRSIEASVFQPDLEVTARKGYFAPTD